MARLQVNRQDVDPGDFAPHASLLNFLRETLGLRGTKEGCGSGDCGACTVIVQGPPDANGTWPTPVNLNSCITPLGAVLDCQVLTVEGVGTPDALHPVQQAMITEHASQCGFCTPGFVMSLVANQLRAESAESLAHQTRSDAIEAISGNLCRCTGYRPILAAALASNQLAATQPVKLFDPATTAGGEEPTGSGVRNYHQPQDLTALREILGKTQESRPPHAPLKSTDLLLAGTTDAWLNVTQHYADLTTAIDLTRVPELRNIAATSECLQIGAAVTHTELIEFFEAEVPCPAITTILQRFGSPQVRNRGTIGGNIANASPIADWPPLLLALDATLTLMTTTGATRRVAIRDYYLDYRKTVLAADEFLTGIELPGNINWQALIAHKISKRIEDDISSTMGAIYLTQTAGKVSKCRIAFGGVAATPVRFTTVEDLLLDKPLNESTIANACAELANTLAPISDVRASADYRRSASVAVLRKSLEEAVTGNRQTLANGGNHE